MIRILLPILLLVFSCEEPVIDGCMTDTACNYNADANDCTQDCAEDWGGIAVLDSCDVCDADTT